MRTSPGLLASEGCTWHDIVRTTCYLRDIERDYDAFNEERTAFYKEQGLDPLPASTGIQAILCRPELLIEIEAIAMFAHGEGDRRKGVGAMRRNSLSIAVCAAGGRAPPLPLAAQSARVCECGKHPPAPPRDRTVAPYAGEPQDLRPYSKFEQPYYENYVEPNIYVGAGRDIPDPKDISEVRIGFFGPLDPSPDKADGEHMLHGAQLAVEEANARGGYGGKPFKLMVHNDYNNWQAKAVYGATRPTDSAIWGSAGDEAVKMIYDDQDWAIFGSISSESTHIILRVALKAEIPIVNSASTDPTIPETYIPWYFTDLQDDRVQAYTLARHIYTELGLKRVALLRLNNRYGRMASPKFRNASIRLGHPVVIEQKFMPGDTDFSRALRIIRESRVDGIVLWADETETANILKQMRAMGMKQRVFGSYRTLGPEMLAQAGPAAEGFEAVFPYDPTRNDPRWLDFNRRFETAVQREAGAVRVAGLRRDECAARLDLQGGTESRAHSRCACRHRRIRRRDRAHDLRSEPEECGADVPGHGCRTARSPTG